MQRLKTMITDMFVRHDIPLPSSAPIATVVRDRMNCALRRRLSDRVLDVCQEACVSGDLDTAHDLLGVLEAMHARRQDIVVDRRLTEEDVVRMREDIASRRAERAAATVMPIEVAEAAE